MALGISNILIGTILVASGLAQTHTTEGNLTSLAIALVVAGAGAMSTGCYQIWRQRYVYE